MTARTAGSLCGFTITNETSYGVTGSTKKFGGVLSMLETPSDETLEYDQGCGTRAWVNIVKTMESFGWTADFTSITGTDWTDWFTYALGSLSGTISPSLSSFTALFRVASDEWMQSKGCKVDSMSVSADSFGSAVKFSVKAMAKRNTFTTTDMTSSAVARPTAKPIFYTSQWERNGASIPVKSWTLTIDNSLVGDPGMDNGEALAAGNNSIPYGNINMTLDLTVTSIGPTWDILKQNGVDDDTLTLTLDGQVITCSGCFLKTDFPKREQGMYDETISYIVKSITVEAEE